MKTLGVIGGAGPMATAYFLQQVIGLTDARCDQDHLHILVDNNPAIPDRTAYILGLSQEDPKPHFLEMGRSLKEAGAEVLAIPCITASFFVPSLMEELGLPIIDTLSLTATYALSRGLSSVGLMATSGTIETGLFQKALEDKGLRVVLPDEENQNLVMKIIYDYVKAGRPVCLSDFNKVQSFCQAAGAEKMILGCTELSVAAMNHPAELGYEAGYIDAMKVLALGSLDACGAKRNRED